MLVWDWRRKEAYKYTRDYDLHEWAWEFLRRNPAYRNAYVEWEAELKQFRSQPRQHDNPVDMALMLYTSLLHDAASKKWGLSSPADPVMPARAIGVFWAHEAGVDIMANWDAVRQFVSDPWPGYPQHLVLRFDFTYPVETQIAIAAEMLHRAAALLEKAGQAAPPKPPPMRFRVSQFATYLRLLDAELDGATIGEIGRVAFPTHQDKRNSVKQMRETARRMMKEDYRELLLLPPAVP